MTVEFQKIDLLGLAIADPIPLRPGTRRILCYQSLIRPHVDLIVHPNPSGDKKDDQITIEKSVGHKIISSITLYGEGINTTRNTQSRIDGYKLRSV